MKVTLLGTGAPLHPIRNTMGMLLEAPGCEPLLIDACSGFEVTRALARLGYERSADQIKHVIVTHQHGDHIGGTAALRIAFDELTFYGHEDALAAVEVLSKATFPKLETLFQHGTRFSPTVVDRHYEIGGFEVSFFEVVHRVPTYAVRVRHGDKVFAYSADSVACEALLACANEADLFLCDAICASTDGYSQQIKTLMHPDASEAAQFAEDAGAKRLALTHIGRVAGIEAMQQEAEAIFSGEVLIPNDGDQLLL